MREILFRGKTAGDWCEGSLIYSPKEDQYYIPEHCGEELSFLVDANTVGQFTGLLDKNGKKIFEGDVGIGGDGRKYEVIYIRETCSFRLDDGDFCEYIDEVEGFIVTGTIHDTEGVDYDSQGTNC